MICPGNLHPQGRRARIGWELVTQQQSSLRVGSQPPCSPNPQGHSETGFGALGKWIAASAVIPARKLGKLLLSKFTSSKCLLGGLKRDLGHLPAGV